MNRLVVCVYVEEKWCGRPFLCDRHLLLFPPSSTKKRRFSSRVANHAHQVVVPCHVLDLLKQSPMVDSIVSSREIYEDYACDFTCFKSIFDVLGKVQHLGSTPFAGAEASLLWYKDMFDNGSQAVQYQALVQFVEVTQKGNWSEAFRARWVLSWFQKGNNTCLSPESR